MICVGLRASFPKVTIRRSSLTRTALKGDLLENVGEIGEIATNVGSTAADSTTAALSNFAVNFPEASEILSTTVRTINEGTAGVAGVSTKLPLDLGITPVLVKSNLSPFFMNIISEPKYWGAIIVFVLVFDIMQNSAAVQKRNRELLAGNEPLQEELARTEANLKTALTLQVDAKKLSKDLDEAKAELAAYKMREEYNTQKPDNQSKKVTESTSATTVSDDKKSGVVMTQELTRLRAELQEQKKKTAAALDQASKATASATSAASTSKSTASTAQVDRERALGGCLEDLSRARGLHGPGCGQYAYGRICPFGAQEIREKKGHSYGRREGGG